MSKQGSGGKGPPKRQARDSDFEDSVSAATPVSGLTPMGAPPLVKLAPKAKPQAKAAETRNTVSVPKAPAGKAPPQKPNGFLKNMLRSAFDRSGPSTQKADAALGRTSYSKEDEDDEPTALGGSYDGIHPAEGLTSRDLWRAVEAPLQSREGRRSGPLYAQVINQFAVGHNPRYAPDGPGKLRAHIFIWDLTRAMNSEVPHFQGAKELTLALTCDWIRGEGPMRGWFRTEAQVAFVAAANGKPVLVMPRDESVNLIAVLRPESLQKKEPVLAAAGLRSGNQLSAQQALGQLTVDYFVHP